MKSANNEAGQNGDEIRGEIANPVSAGELVTAQEVARFVIEGSVLYKRILGRTKYALISMIELAEAQ